MGEHNLLTDPDCEKDECADPVVNIPVAEAIVHENYNPLNSFKTDDIALIRVERSINFTDWVKPIPLPDSVNLRNKTFDGVPLIVAGFGATQQRMFE